MSYFTNPGHPYTEALLSAVAIPDPEPRGRQQRIILEGEIPSTGEPAFRLSLPSRCRYRQARARLNTPSRPLAGRCISLGGMSFSNSCALESLTLF
jgi:oligopeptide/dipeptide ABC transporter ATP-binding protein